MEFHHHQVLLQHGFDQSDDQSVYYTEDKDACSREHSGLLAETDDKDQGGGTERARSCRPAYALSERVLVLQRRNF